jgi:uncharacterized glyoxalase superfamily protein PhnB
MSGAIRSLVPALAAASLAAAPAAVRPHPVAPKEPTMSAAFPSLQRLAPVLVVDAVEPCVAFWTGRFGFAAENQVPGPDGRLQFASVSKDGIEIMYQTRASVVAERPDSAGELTGHSTGLFFTVGDLDAVERAVAGAPVVKARHRTFYGSEEIYVREPGGNVVGFAQFAK